jgi:hemerythrin superfamily protein
MEIREMLKKDHDLVKELLEKMSSGKLREDALKATFDEFKIELTSHSKAEEKVVYAKLKKEKDEDTQESGIEGEIEHGLVDQLLQVMARSRSKGSTRWEAYLKVIKDLLEHHIKEEERTIFKQLGEHFDAAALQKMAEEMEQEKNKVMKAAA